LHNVTAPRPGVETGSAAELQIGAGVTRGKGQRFVERSAIEV
jgi:hypothetical protein